MAIIFGLAVNGLAGGILVAGAGSWLLPIASVGALVTQAFLLAICGYLCYHDAPFPKVVYSFVGFVINAGLHYLFVLNVLGPGFKRIASQYETYPEIDINDVIEHPLELLIQSMALYVAGAACAALLFSTKSIRIRQRPRLQRMGLLCFGIASRMLSAVVILFATIAFLIPVVPEALGLVFSSALPNTFAGKLMRAPLLESVFGIVLLALFFLVKLGVAVGYIAIGAWLGDMSSRFFFAAQPAPTQPPQILLLRSFEDDTALINDGSAVGDRRDVGVSKKSFLRGIPLVNLIIDFFEIAGAIVWKGSQPLLAIVDAPFRARTGLIGNPKEALPRWNADWYYYDNSEWEASVLRMMSDARLIILVVGPTPSVGWEIEQLFRNQHLAKSLFLFPAPDVVAIDEGMPQENANEIHNMLEKARTDDMTKRVAVFTDSAKRAGVEGEYGSQLKSTTIAFTCTPSCQIERIWADAKSNGQRTEYQSIVRLVWHLCS